MKILTHEHWDRGLDCAKYRLQCVGVLGVLKKPRKTGCIDNKSHLGIFNGIFLSANADLMGLRNMPFQW